VVEHERMYERLRGHIANSWRDHRREEFVWNLGPIRTKLPRLRVVRVEPKEPDDPWIYSSLGAWETTATSPKEFFLLSPVEEPLHVELLSMVSNYHSDHAHHLDVGSIIPIGRPWIVGAYCDHLLVSLPYPYGPRLERCEINGTTIQFLWLLPIFESEAQFARLHGTEALQEKFDLLGINYLDEKRPAVA